MGLLAARPSTPRISVPQYAVQLTAYGLTAGLRLECDVHHPSGPTPQPTRITRNPVGGWTAPNPGRIGESIIVSMILGDLAFPSQISFIFLVKNAQC
jgi:hypothetical protein